MLEAIGAAAVAELFEEIPEGVRLGRALDLEDGLSEHDVYERLRALGGRIERVASDPEPVHA